MSWGQTLSLIGPPIHDWEDEYELKIAYARFVADDPSNWELKGHSVFPEKDDYGRALQAKAWYYDPVVQNELRRLRRAEVSEVDPDPLPSFNEYAKALWDEGRSQRNEAKDRVGFMRQFGEAMEYIKKPGTNVNIDNSVRQAVLVVPPDISTPEEQRKFVEDFKSSQMKLAASAKSNRS